MATQLPSASNKGIKVANMCRTCLAEDHEMHSIFEANSSYNGIPLQHIVEATTGLQISECDGLPPLICTSCKLIANHAYEFKKQSQEADLTLRSLVSRNISTAGLEDHKHIKSEVITPVKDEFNHFYQDYDTADFDMASPADVLTDIGSTKKETKTEEDSENICTFCNSTFESKAILQSHQLKCFKGDCDEVKTSICPLCGESFDDGPALLKHVWLAHEKNKKTGLSRKSTKPAKKLPPKITKVRTKSNIKGTPLTVPIEVPIEIDTVVPDVKKLQKICCGVCNVVLDTQAELNAHVSSHSGGGVLCCALCEKMFLEPVHFNQHFRSDHEDAVVENLNTMDNRQNEGIKDGISGSESTELLLEHRNFSQHTRLMSLEGLMESNYTLEEQYLQVCTECGQLFFSAEQLVMHVDVEHLELSNRCNFCSKSFSTTKSAARHRKVCKQVDRKHGCGTCGLKFAYELTLNKHILREHKGQSVSVNFIDPKYNQDKNFTCKTCTKTFFRQDLLDKHLKNHMPNDGKRYECDICKKRFNRKDNLRSHMQIHDPQRARTASNCLCLYCGRSFSNSSNLIVHMRRHTGEKPYKCDFCGKGFPRSSDLQCHRRSHTGEKPYLCNICGKGFRRNNKLSRHMRVHTGQRPYKCTYCEKAFSQSNDLTLHIRRHTGDKPYVCRVCGERFIQGTALHNHRRTHNHYAPSTSDGAAGTLLLVQPQPSLTTVTAMTVKKVITKH